MTPTGSPACKSFSGPGRVARSTGASFPRLARVARRVGGSFPGIPPGRSTGRSVTLAEPSDGSRRPAGRAGEGIRATGTIAAMTEFDPTPYQRIPQLSTRRTIALATRLLARLPSDLPTEVRAAARRVRNALT